MNSIRRTLFLTFSGGFMDAYTYVLRGHVFANGQTGNFILLGINIATGNFAEITKYIVPIISFVIGLLIGSLTIKRSPVHGAKYSIILKIIIFFIVSHLSIKYNLIANSLISLVCGIQFEVHKRHKELPVVTTMCVGNLKNAIENLFSFTATKDIDCLKRVSLYFLLIFCFVVGAVCGNFAVSIFATHAILISCIALLFAI